jgi:hypothetical protein
MPLLEKSNLVDEYDFGDSWEHLIHLEKILEATEIKGHQAPFCSGGRGANKQEDSHYEEDNDADPFDQADINERLHAAFPAETTMPDEYRSDQTPIWGAESAAQQLQMNPELMDALLAGKTVVQDGDNAPEIKEPEPSRPKQQVLADGMDDP